MLPAEGSMRFEEPGLGGDLVAKRVLGWGFGAGPWGSEPGELQLWKT